MCTFIAHRRTAHPDPRLRCSFCDYVAPNPAYKAVHEKKLHLGLFCRSCTGLFDTLEEKATHKCTPPERWQCGQCDKNYKSKSELANHVDIVHEGKRFPCTLCPDILASAQARKRHVRLVHETRVKKLRCQTCGKAFKDRQTLRGHERTHDATRQGSSDPCPECGKRFSSRGALREHVKTVHRKASFRHTCEDCGQTFPYSHMLQIHAEMVHLKGTLLVCQVKQNSLA